MSKRRARAPVKDHELDAAVQRALAHNVPLSAICREADVDQSTLWKWRNGKSSPTMSTRAAVLVAIKKLTANGAAE